MRPLLLDLLCLTWVLLLAILTSRVQQPERIHQEMDNNNQHELAAKVGVATSRNCRRLRCFTLSDLQVSQSLTNCSISVCLTRVNKHEV